MDKDITNDVLDLRYTSGVIIGGNKTLTINETALQATCAIHKKLTGHTQIHPNSHTPNSVDYQYKCAVADKNNVCSFKKHFLLHFILIIALLGGVFFVLGTTPHISQGTSSSNKYPLLNPDLCDSVNPYYGSSWFTPSPTGNFICDVPIQISEIYILDMRIYPGLTYPGCLSKLECVTEIGLQFHRSSSKFNFFIDYNANVYQARGWMCPYKSGQLWVGIIPEEYNAKMDSDEMKRILKHFNTEIVSYAEHCRIFSSNNVTYNYLNTSFV